MDPAEQLRQLKSYRNTDDRLVEECVSDAVAAALDDVVVIHSTRYVFQGKSGDLDGMVVGSLHGKDVVVLVEAKHNMDSCATKAKSELFDAGAYWAELVQLAPDSDTDESVCADFIHLQVERYKQHSIMFAFGGSKFSAETVVKSFEKIATPWFRVVANSAGKFTAEEFMANECD